MSYEIADRCRPPQRNVVATDQVSPATDGPALIDGFGRKITYLRLSVTDRCDFRCTYCMSENMRFLPHEALMTFEEATRLARVFVSLGVTKIRVTGGEPLVRKDLPSLISQLSALPGLRELAITTNGSQLARYADELKSAGVTAVNISLDSIRAERFAKITRTGRLNAVLDGITAARKAGFPRIRLNCVLMRGVNDDEIENLARFAVRNELDLAYIEEMPLGGIPDRDQRRMLADEVVERLSVPYRLIETGDNTGGPARYWKIEGSATRIGLITPHSHNFCHTCNRVRVTARGELYPCLGQDDAFDLLPTLRDFPDDDAALRDAVLKTMGIKPAGHEFDGAGGGSGAVPKIMRFMSLTGG